MNLLNQRTVRSKASCTGIGLHSGTEIELSLVPAPVNSGIVFVRTDVEPRVEMQAVAANVVDTTLATTLGKGSVRVGTIEHLMAALAGMGIDNCRVEVNGPEVPIMDGSAAPFVEMIERAGVQLQEETKRFLIVRKAVTVRDGDKEASLLPASQLSISFTIDFEHPVIANQTFRLDFGDGFFKETIAGARTFGFLREVETLKRMGLAKGGSLENAIVVDDERILNTGGLRFPDEFVRHKILDSIGDLSLIGMPMIGHLVAYKSGHMLNHRLVTEVLGDPSNYEVIAAGERHELERLDIRPPQWGSQVQVA